MILKLVPRDHVDQLPVPKRIKDYLKTPNYYSENIEDIEGEEEEEKVSMPNQESNEPEVENTNVYLAANNSESEIVSANAYQEQSVLLGQGEANQ